MSGQTLVSKQWLLARMNEPDIVIVDCRFDLGQPEAGREDYISSHIPGAVYLDLNTVLSAPVEVHGGRHPLPDLGVLAERLGRAGIGNGSRVVAYDDQGGMYASRLWWMLRWLGHDAIHVMEEGFTAWKDAGYPVTNAQRVIVPTAFVPEVRADMLAHMEEVRDKLGRPDVLLVDSRDPARYRGETEPIDAKAGHIPGAINQFWKDNVDERGAWKPEAQRRKQLATIVEVLEAGREVIVYCGSGVSACPNVLALHELGYPQVRLYAGSWSDWSSYEKNPIVTGNE